MTKFTCRNNRRVTEDWRTCQTSWNNIIFNIAVYSLCLEIVLSRAIRKQHCHSRGLDSLVTSEIQLVVSGSQHQLDRCYLIELWQTITVLLVCYSRTLSNSFSLIFIVGPIDFYSLVYSGLSVNWIINLFTYYSIRWFKSTQNFKSQLKTFLFDV